MAQGNLTTDGSRETANICAFLGLIAKGCGSFTELVMRTLELHKEDPVNKAIAESLKHDDAVMFEVDNFDEARNLRKKFSENGIHFATDVQYQDKVYVIIPRADQERASEIVNTFYDNRSGGVFSPEFIDAYANHKVQEIKDLTEEEASLFILRCHEAHVPVNVDGPSEGTYRIRFAEKDLDKMDGIRIDVAATLSGPAKDLYKDQLKWRNEYQSAVMTAVINGEFPDGSTMKEGSALVGTDGKRVEVSRMYIKTYDGGMCKSYSRNGSAEDLRRSTTEITRFVQGMEGPVFMDVRDYNALKAMNTSEREEFFASKERAGFLLPRSVYKENLVKSISHGRTMDGRSLRKGDMIIDDKGNSIEAHGKEVTITTKDGAQTVDRTTEEGRDALKTAVQGMHNPVFLDGAHSAEYKALDDEKKQEYIVQVEVTERTFVQGRHVLTQDEMRAIARAEAMRHTVDVHLHHDGIEMPVTEKMTYHDASLVFGLTTAETETFNDVMQQDVVTEHDKNDIGAVVEEVEAHFGKTFPSETLIPISAEEGIDRIFNDDHLPELSPDFHRSLDLDDLQKDFVQ